MLTLIRYLFITAFVSIATAGYLLCFTPKGFRYELVTFAKNLPGELTIQKVKGTLFTGFTLENISYKTTDFQATIETLQVTWHPEQLLQKKIAIENLLLKNATLSLQGGETETLSFNPLHFLQYITFKHLNIQNLLVKKEKSSIKLNGEMTDKWDMQWNIHISELQDFSPDLHGFLQSEGTLKGARHTPHILASLHGKQLRYADHQIGLLEGQTTIFVKPFAASSIQLKLRDITFHEQFFKTLQLAITGNIQFENHDLTSQLSIHTGLKNDLSASFTLPHFSSFTNPEQEMRGNIHFHVVHLDALHHLYSEIKRPEGLLKGELNLKGTLSKPILTGNFQLDEGKFRIPSLGIQPNHIHLEGQLDASVITLQGHFRSGEGEGNLQGKINCQSDMSSNINIQGHHLRLIDLAEYKVNVSPDIHLEFTYPTLQLLGKLTIDESEIKPRNFDDTQTLPDEIILINQQESTHDLNIETLLKLDLHLSDRVHIRYDNLEALLAGDLRITKETNSLATARGELYTINGKYTAYGQKLTIDTGHLIYKGHTLLNPGLLIEATKSVRRVLASNPNNLSTNTPSQSIYAGTEKLVIGVRILGTADRPQISLFSLPANLNQTDILSYLILGYPQSNATGYQGTAMLGVLTSLYPGGHLSNLTEKLEQKLGLSELNVGSVQSFNPISKKVESNTAFIVGKQITNKLSVHYSVGVFDPISILNLRYQLDNHWAVQSETSTIDNAADLVYTFERN